MFLNHINVSSSLMGQSYSKQSNHEDSLNTDKTTTAGTAGAPTTTLGEDSLYSSPLPHPNHTSSPSDELNFMSTIPSSLFLSPITSNDSAYHVDHEISPVSSQDSLETVVQADHLLPQKRVKNLKHYLSRKFKKDALSDLKNLSLNDINDTNTAVDAGDSPQNSLSSSTNSLSSGHGSQTSLNSGKSPLLSFKAGSGKWSSSKKSTKASPHLPSYTNPQTSYASPQPSSASAFILNELYVIQSNDDSNQEELIQDNTSSVQDSKSHTVANIYPRTIPQTIPQTYNQKKRSSSLHVFGYSPDKSSLDTERPPLSRKISANDDTQVTSRKSSSHLQTYQTQPSISRRPSSQLLGKSTPIKSPEHSLQHSRKNSTQLLLTARDKSSRNNSLVNLKNTFKLHPNPNDALNPIDTLLSHSHTNLPDLNYVPSILNEGLKIWDTSDTPDNISIADTIESKNSEDYFAEPEAVQELGSASPLLSLPLEILYRIIEIVYHDDQILSINSNLENFSRTIPFLTRRLNQLSLCFLYKYTIFNRPHAFDKFLTNLKQHQFIGKYVEFMDFQQFTSVGLGRTGRMNQEIQMVTSRTITEALSMTPNLIEFMASENIQDDMDVNVLDYLFNRLYKIQTIDFCGASSEKFVQAFRELIIDNDIPAMSHEFEPLSPTLSPTLSPIASMSSPGITPVSTNVISPVLSNNDSVDEANMSVDSPKEYEVHIAKASSLNYLFKLSFHDCTSLTSDIFIKILPHLHNIRRLDLNHTAITSLILNQYLPHTARLTHLSLSRSSKLTTKDLINFLTQHPAVANNTLQWLNLQIDSNVVSPLSDIYLNYTLKHLKGSQIVYLNIGGLPIKNPTMKIIKNRFPQLESLGIAHASLTVDELNSFMKDNTTLKYLDLSGTKLSRSNILSFLKTNFYLNLEAIELDYKVLYELTSDGEYIKALPEQQSYIEQASNPQVWKFYDNEGRRAWIYKLSEDDPSYKDIINGTSNYDPATTNLVYYDLETGSKITSKITSPKFLKYASRKINCSIGYLNLQQCKTKKYLENIDQEDVWPVEFSQRGIYNYYSLNVK